MYGLWSGDSLQIDKFGNIASLPVETTNEISTSPTVQTQEKPLQRTVLAMNGMVLSVNTPAILRPTKEEKERKRTQKFFSELNNVANKMISARGVHIGVGETTDALLGEDFKHSTLNRLANIAYTNYQNEVEPRLFDTKQGVSFVPLSI